MPDIRTEQKYKMKRDLAMEISGLVGIEPYDPSRTEFPPADFLRYEREQIYEALAESQTKTSPSAK